MSTGKTRTNKHPNRKTNSKNTKSTDVSPFRIWLHNTDWRKIFNQTILIFTIGCIFGTYYEEIYILIRHLITDGQIELVSRAGLLYGPFSPVYGLGAVGIYWAFYLTKAKWYICFLGGAVLGGGFEYLMSVLQEMLFHTRSWDYSDRLLNIDGRTTIPYAAFWGLLALATACWLLPLLARAYDALAGKRMNTFCIVLAIFLLCDAELSIAASIRQAERRDGDPANTELDVILDEYYPDDKMDDVYENAEYIPDS